MTEKVRIGACLKIAKVDANFKYSVHIQLTKSSQSNPTFATVVIGQLRPEFKFPAKIDLLFLKYKPSDDDLTNPSSF